MDDVIEIRPLTESDAAAFKQIRLQAIAGSLFAIAPTHAQEAGHALAENIRLAQATVDRLP